MPGRRLALTLICLIGLAGPASADARLELLLRQLRAQGFTQIETERTWLGRIKIEAESPTAEREIIYNPRTGEILRDYWESEDEEVGLVDPSHKGEDGEGDE